MSDWRADAACAGLDGELLPPRIRSRVEFADDHWIWIGQLNNKGYGLIHYNGQKRGAHRVIYELLVGAVPSGLELDHLCRITSCVRPQCMEAVTHAENQRRLGLAQTHCRRQKHPYTPENTYRDRNGRRRCRTCARERRHR